MLLFCDTETTNLIQPQGTSQNNQPKITEIYISKTDLKLNQVDEFETLVNPQEKLSYFIIKHTGLTDQMLRHAPTWKKVYKPFKKFVSNGALFIAHNAPFDWGMIELECGRLSKPNPIRPRIFCTVEQSVHITGRKLKLDELYFLATGKTSIDGHHAAKNDVEALKICYAWLIKTPYKKQMKAGENLKYLKDLRATKKGK